MLSAGAWKLSQQNLITFVLVDSNGAEVTGLGSGFTLEISNAGGAFAASAGTKAEMGLGWYSYESTSSESNTYGPVSIVITGAGVAQQNMEYVVEERTINAIEYTYAVTNSATTNPLPGVEIWIATDEDGNNVVWHGVTDDLGIARDDQDRLPRLDAGTYFIFRQLVGFQFSDPDIEVIS